MKFLLIPLAVGALLFFLYDRGAISVKMGRALVYIGSIYSARYKSFHGKLKRVYRPAESRVYCFVFSSELTCGSVELELLDKEKKQLLLLKGQETKEVFLEQGKRYQLILRCRSADGAHHLEIQ